MTRRDGRVQERETRGTCFIPLGRREGYHTLTVAVQSRTGEGDEREGERRGGGGRRGGAGAGGAAQQPGTLPPSPGSAGPAQESRKEPCYGRPLQIHPAPAPRPSKSAVIHPSAVAAPASLPLFRYPPLFSSPCLMAESIVTRLFADPLVTCCVTLPASLCPSPHSYPTALSAMPAPGLRFSLFRLPSD